MENLVLAVRRKMVKDNQGSTAPLRPEYGFGRLGGDYRRPFWTWWSWPAAWSPAGDACRHVASPLACSRTCSNSHCRGRGYEIDHARSSLFGSMATSVRCADGSWAWTFCETVLYAQKTAEEGDVTSSSDADNIFRKLGARGHWLGVWFKAAPALKVWTRSSTNI